MNCIPDPKCAYLAMKIVYEQFSGYKFDEPLPKSGKGRVKAIHYIQSFDPKDKISPELAHQIGRTFAHQDRQCRYGSDGCVQSCPQN